MLSKTLTILLADIQGYTSRTSKQTREEMELLSVRPMLLYKNMWITMKGGW